MKTGNLMPFPGATGFHVLEIYQELGNSASGSRSALQGSEVLCQKGKEGDQQPGALRRTFRRKMSQYMEMHFKEECTERTAFFSLCA